MPYRTVAEGTGEIASEDDPLADEEKEATAALSLYLTYTAVILRLLD